MKRLPYQEIRSEEEFLNGIQRKINLLGYELQEQEQVKIRKKKKFLGRLKLIGVLGTVSLFSWLWLPGLYGKQGTAYLWSFSILIITTVYEQMIEVRRSWNNGN